MRTVSVTKRSAFSSAHLGILFIIIIFLIFMRFQNIIDLIYSDSLKTFAHIFGNVRSDLGSNTLCFSCKLYTHSNKERFRFLSHIFCRAFLHDSPYNTDNHQKDTYAVLTGDVSSFHADPNIPDDGASFRSARLLHTAF